MDTLKQSIILFDLDGTLTDSEEGIIRSTQYMQEKMGQRIWSAIDRDGAVGRGVIRLFNLSGTYAFYCLPRLARRGIWGRFDRGGDGDQRLSAEIENARGYRLLWYGEYRIDGDRPEYQSINQPQRLSAV